MSMSRRAKRMLDHRRRGRSVPLNLVSLMDIFTILVFFLLVNSSEVETLPNAKTVSIPESVAEQKPRETVVVMVTPEHILVEGEAIAATADMLSDDVRLIEPLQQALRDQLARSYRGADSEPTLREVTILGDRSLPYSLLKKVMASCTGADYTQVSLAVMQKPPAEQEAAG